MGTGDEQMKQICEVGRRWRGLRARDSEEVDVHHCWQRLMQPVGNSHARTEDLQNSLKLVEFPLPRPLYSSRIMVPEVKHMVPAINPWFQELQLPISKPKIQGNPLTPNPRLVSVSSLEPTSWSHILAGDRTLFCNGPE